MYFIVIMLYFENELKDIEINIEELIRVIFWDFVFIKT